MKKCEVRYSSYNYWYFLVHLGRENTATKCQKQQMQIL